jgi:thiamine biosynthesis lipoprotein ApbE
LRPGQISAELESLAAMTGVQLPFGQSAHLFEALTLVSVSDQTVAKATQAMGDEVQRQETEWLSQSRDEAWLQQQQRLAERPQRLYGALDAAINLKRLSIGSLTSLYRPPVSLILPL